MSRTQFVDVGPFYVARGAMRGTYRLPRRPRIGADYRFTSDPAFDCVWAR